MADEIIDIVVTSTRLYGIDPFQAFGSFFWHTWMSLPSTSRDSEWLFGPYNPSIEDRTSPNHLKKVLIINSIQEFAERMTDLKERLSVLPSSMPVNIDGSLTMTVAELLAKLDSLKFIVVDKQYPAGYGGANYGSSIEIKWNTLSSYMSRDDYGFNYLVLHEIAHNTIAGIASRSWNVNQHRDNGGTAATYTIGNQFFQRQEGQANTIARNMADSLGLMITSSNGPRFPPHGFVPLGL